jgi:NADH:ubiquinone oxidoreductase subunit 5 (subunit L)/multisubunit Na+/H+ antiporter MnhA subunit
MLGIWVWVGLLISALKAWSAHDPDGVISSARTYGGLYVLMGASLGLQAEWQLLIGINLVLSLSAISISWQQCQYLDVHNPRSYWRAIPAGLGVLSLAGIPLLIGFPARIAIYWTIFQAHKWFLMLGLMIAEALVVGALLRTVLDVESVPETPLPSSGQEPSEGREFPVSDKKTEIVTLLSTLLTRWGQKLILFFKNSVPDVLLSRLDQINWRREIAYVLGSSLAIGILVFGIAPGVLWPDGTLRELGYWFGMPRLPVWAALLLPVVGGVVLYRRQDVTLILVQDWWPLLDRLIVVDWVCRAAEKSLSRVRALIWGATQVVDGAGYMAWVLVVCLVLLLLVLSR